MPLSFFANELLSRTEDDPLPIVIYPDPTIQPGLTNIPPIDITVPVQTIALSVILSAITYGFVVLLSSNCLWLTMKTKQFTSPRMRIFLITYIMTMFGMSTGAMVQEIRIMMNQFAIVGQYDYIPGAGSSVPLTTPLATWGADGFLMWRCIIIYNGASRATKSLLYSALSMVSMVSLAGGIVILVTFWQNQDGAGGELLVASSTLLCNTCLSVLIALRLINHRRALKLNGIDTPATPLYKTVIAICVESSALIAVVSTVFIIDTVATLYSTSPIWEYIHEYTLYLFPHISVISSLLIIFRVAQGRAYSSTSESTSLDLRSRIHFNQSITTDSA